MSERLQPQMTTAALDTALEPAVPDDPLRILLADDQPLFAQALEIMLGLDGRFEVVGSARHGGEAVELAAALRPDVVLMDLDMPVLDGLEATRRVVEALPAIRVVVLSGSDSRSDLDAAVAAGACAYVTKDRLPDLVRVLAALPRRRSALA